MKSVSIDLINKVCYNNNMLAIFRKTLTDDREQVSLLNEKEGKEFLKWYVSTGYHFGKVYEIKESMTRYILQDKIIKSDLYNLNTDKVRIFTFNKEYIV